MAKNTFVPVGNVARKQKKEYVSVNGVARKVKKIYRGDSNGLAQQVWSGFDGVLYMTCGSNMYKCNLPNSAFTKLSDLQSYGVPTRSYSVAYHDGVFVYTSSNSVLVTKDFVTVTVALTISGAFFRSVIWSGDKFVVVTDTTTDSKVGAYSYDGYNWAWSTMSDGSYNSIKAVVVAHGNGVYIAPVTRSTYDYTNYMGYSTDGISWSLKSINSYAHGQVLFYKGKFVSIPMFFATGSYKPYFRYSTDGLNWTDDSTANTLFNYGETVYNFVHGGDYLYLSTTRGVYRYTFGSCERMTVPELFNNGSEYEIYAINVCNNRITIGGRGGNYYYSDNKGANWVHGGAIPNTTSYVYINAILTNIEPYGSGAV